MGDGGWGSFVTERPRTVLTVVRYLHMHMTSSRIRRTSATMVAYGIVSGWQSAQQHGRQTGWWSNCCWCCCCGFFVGHSGIVHRGCKACTSIGLCSAYALAERIVFVFSYVLCCKFHNECVCVFADTQILHMLPCAHTFICVQWRGVLPIELIVQFVAMCVAAFST